MNTKPDWNKLRKELPFEVPEHYFEGVRDRVAERIHQPEPALPWYRTAAATAKPYFALASLFFILFFGIRLYIGPQEEEPGQYAQTEEQETSQILEHLMFQADVLELMAFDLYLEESAGSETVTETNTDEEADEIIQFLMREGIDISTIASVF